MRDLRFGFAIALLVSGAACSAGSDSTPSPTTTSAGSGGTGGTGGQGGSGGEPATTTTTTTATGSGGTGGEGGAGGAGGAGGQGGAGGGLIGVCGDGNVEPPEECDDANTDDGDGCSSLCKFEPTGPDDVCPGVEITLTGTGDEPRVGSASGSTTQVLHQYGSFCGGSGKEAVFMVTPDVLGLLTATLTSDFDAVLHARSSCSDDATELACNDAAAPNAPEVISFQVAPNTPYYLFVDGYGGAEGNYTLDVVVASAFCGNGEAEAPETCDDANAVDGDGCSSSCVIEPGGIPDDCPGQALFLSGVGSEPRVISLLGDTSPLTTGLSPVSCSGAGNNAVFAVTPDVDGSMRVDMTADYDNATLHVRSECDTSSTQLDCVEATEPAQALSVTVPVLANTTYFVIADSSSSSYDGPFQLEITVTPGACGNDELDGGEECDDGNAAVGDGCGPACILEPPAGSNDVCPGSVLPLVGVGNDPRVGIVTATTATIVSNYSASPCTGGTASASAKDAVYQVVPDVSGQLHAVVSAQFDSAIYARSVCTSTGSTDLLGCIEKVDGNGPESLSIPVVAGSTYFLFVDGNAAAQAGVFELAVEVTAGVCGDGILDGGEGCDDANANPGDGCDASCQLEAVGPNDVCPGEELLLVDQGNATFAGSVASGNTNLASNITLTGCTSAGRDAIYSVTSPIDGVMTASVPTAAFNASVGVRTTCDVSNTQLTCANANSGNGGEEISFSVVAGGVYYVVVDSTSASNALGPFELDVTVKPPGCGDGLISAGEVCDDGNSSAGDGCDAACTLEPLPGNDVCPGYSVTLVGSGSDPRTAVITTDTTPLAANYSGTCGGSAREAVYVVTPDVAGTLTAKLLAAHPTVLYARATCADAASEAKCDDVVTLGSTDISFPVAASTPYYLFVDGFSGAFGVSTLNIKVTP